jgi:hypothetical protein
MALRPTLSDGLPFSGLECFLYRTEQVIGPPLRNFNQTLANTSHERKAELMESKRISVNQIRRNYGEKEWEEELYNFAGDKETKAGSTGKQ